MTRITVCWHGFGPTPAHVDSSTIHYFTKKHVSREVIELGPTATALSHGVINITVVSENNDVLTGMFSTCNRNGLPKRADLSS